MKLLSAFLLLFIFLPLVCSSHKKVKILVPTRVQHIHHTKIVKIPEYHHYFHDKGRPRRKERPPQPPPQEDFYNYEKDAYNLNEQNNLQNNNINNFNTNNANNNYQQGHSHTVLYDDFDYYPENSDNNFERVFYKFGYNYNRNPNGNGNGNNNINHHNKFEPQHYYHRV